MHHVAFGPAQGVVDRKDREGALTLSRIAELSAETITFTVPFMPRAATTVAVMLWLPGVVKVTPLVNVWEPASFTVK